LNQPWGEGQQGGLLGLPGTEGLGLLQTPLSRSDPLGSLGSGQIDGRLLRGWLLIYARPGPNLSTFSGSLISAQTPLSVQSYFQYLAAALEMISFLCAASELPSLESIKEKSSSRASSLAIDKVF